jgi:hypothetical protein
MSVGTRQVLQVAKPAQKKSNLNADRRANFAAVESAARVNVGANARRKPRVFVAAENRLLREALSRMLVKNGEIEVVGMDMTEPFRTEDLLKEDTDILLLSSRGNRNEDLTAVRRVRTTAPKVQILLIGVTGEEAEFLQCVRSGSSRLSPARRLHGKRSGRRARPTRRRSDLPWDALRNAVPVHGTGSDLLPFRQRSPAAGIDAPRTTIDSLDCRGPHEQRNRQSLLSLGANGEEPSLSHETQDWRRRSSGHRAGLSHAGLHAVDFRSWLSESWLSGRVWPRWMPLALS